MQKSAIATMLKSEDPSQRIEALCIIADNPNEKTRHVLASFASKDPDQHVRDYAHQREFQLQNQNPTSPQDRQQEAHQFLNEAVNAMIAQNAGDARVYARRAFKLAPELQHDDLARDIAVDVMKMPADDAIELLLSNRDVFEVDKAFRKKMGYYYSDQGVIYRLRAYFGKYDVTWQDVLIDVGLYVVVITLPIFLLLLIATGVFVGGIVQMASAGNLDLPFSLVYGFNELGEYGLGALSLGLMFLMVGQVGTTLFSIFAFQMVLTHFSANWFLGGNGSFRRLIHRALIPVTGFSLFIWALIFITPAMYVIGLGELVESGLIGILTMLGIGTFIFNLSNTIGRVYDFDLGKGCLAMMFPYIVLFSMNCIVWSLFYGRVLGKLLFGT